MIFADLVITNPWKKAGAFREYFHYSKVFKNGYTFNLELFRYSYIIFGIEAAWNTRLFAGPKLQLSLLGFSIKLQLMSNRRD
ncbi:hypothetical protein EB001_03155 [bacterium]|nr:hypothetical protein [bacterium]